MVGIRGARQKCRCEFMYHMSKYLQVINQANKMRNKICFSLLSQTRFHNNMQSRSECRLLTLRESRVVQQREGALVPGPESHLFPPLPLLPSRDSRAHRQTSQRAQTNSVSLPAPLQPSTHPKADPWSSLSLRARHTSVLPVLSGWICKRDSPILELARATCARKPGSLDIQSETQEGVQAPGEHIRSVP